MTAKRTEEYLETIYEIEEGKGYAKVKDVASILDVSLSAVSEMFKKLSEKGYVNYEKYSGVTLTKKGRDIATDLMGKHRVLRDFFLIIGIDERTADEDACNIEHVVQPRTMERLMQLVIFIQSHEDPLWLERFRKFYETGELEECPREREGERPT